MYRTLVFIALALSAHGKAVENNVARDNLDQGGLTSDNAYYYTASPDSFVTLLIGANVVKGNDNFQAAKTLYESLYSEYTGTIPATAIDSKKFGLDVFSPQVLNSGSNGSNGSNGSSGDDTQGSGSVDADSESPFGPPAAQDEEQSLDVSQGDFATTINGNVYLTASPDDYLQILKDNLVPSNEIAIATNAYESIFNQFDGKVPVLALFEDPAALVAASTIEVQSKTGGVHSLSAVATSAVESSITLKQSSKSSQASDSGSAIASDSGPAIASDSGSAILTDSGSASASESHPDVSDPAPTVALQSHSSHSASASIIEGDGKSLAVPMAMAAVMFAANLLM